ncbi:MAG: FecR family protein [Candidatus Omnitrophota bacterium]
MKMKSILPLCAFLLMPCVAMAGAVPIGKVTAVEGRVDVTRSPDNEAVSLAEGLPIFEGDSVRTKGHSKAELEFTDRSTVKIAPNTRMEIKEFKVAGSAREHAEIHIARGKVLADVSKTGRPDTFMITTPNSKGAVKGTQVLVLYQAERTSALVKDGRLSICNVALPGQVKDIANGEAVMVPFDAPPEAPRPYMESEFMLHEKDTKPTVIKAVSIGKTSAAMSCSITTLVGGVRVLKKGASDWHYAKPDETLGEGDRIETSEDGKATLLLDNGNLLHIQPGSRIALATLKRDPKTGEFDNTFESDMGKVKAVVEKLGKNSNFRIKTPTAMCGVRGTVMFLTISPAATQAFYEGGGGIVTNTISGDTQFVGSGQNTVSSNTGAVAAPAMTSNEARTSLNASFDYGVVHDGYTAPANDAGATGEGGKHAIGLNKDGGGHAKGEGKGGPGAFQVPPALIPITEANRPHPIPGVSYIESLTFAGLVGKIAVDGSTVIFSPELPYNGMDGSFSLSVSVFNQWITVGKGSVTGGVARNVYIPELYAFWVSDDFKCKTDNNGQYRGFLGASLSKSTDADRTTLKGKALCLYRDPSGWAGTMTFTYEGKYWPVLKTFNSLLAESDDVVFNQREVLGAGYDLNGASLVTKSVYGRGVGSFDAGGDITCGATGSDTGLSGVTFNLPDLDWGIWQLQAQGTYTSTTSDDWVLAVGGEQYDDCSWLGTMDGILWDDRDPVPGQKTNQLVGEFRGVFFTLMGEPGDYETFAGGYILDGDVVGIADPTATPDMTWQAMGGGEWYVAYKNFSEEFLGFNAAQLAAFVNVPITQISAAENMAKTAGSQQFTTFNMDTRLYGNGSSDYIWAGIISGTFKQSAQPSAGWTVTLTETTPTSASITFKDGTWNQQGNRWSAIVDLDASPVIDGHPVTSGQAGGTFMLDGDNSQFEGVAAGTSSVT